MKMLLTWFGCLLLCVSVYFFSSYATEDGFAVEIKVADNQQVYSYIFDTNVEVIFHDINLYHENLFLSYHVYEADGALVEYENQRIPIIMETNSSSYPLKIDLSAFSDSSNTKKFIVEFDIIDIQNIYWYSDGDLRFKADNLYVEQNFTKAFLSGVFSPIQQHPYIFAVNCICLLMSVVVVVKYRKTFE